MALQDRIQSQTVTGEDSSNPLNVIFDDISGHIAVDYSSYYNRIASALETIATNSDSIKNNLEIIAEKQTAIETYQKTIAEKQTAMETYQKKLKELGEGEGIRVISPFELFSFITTYRILVEEGKVLEWRDKQPTDKEIGKALNDIGKYIDKIRKNIPRSF